MRKKRRRPQRKKPEANRPRQGGYQVFSDYGGNTRRPYVQIVASDPNATISVHEARDLAYVILSAAEAAEMEGMFMEFMFNEIGVVWIRRPGYSSVGVPCVMLFGSSIMGAALNH